eukprot:31190-Pelagococcus_subviridis.AAC.8
MPCTFRYSRHCATSSRPSSPGASGSSRFVNSNTFLLTRAPGPWSHSISLAAWCALRSAS